MATTPVTLDFSKAIPIGDGAAPPDPSQADPSHAGALQGAMAYSATQNPDQYANLLKLQKQTGIPPAVSNGNEQQVKQAADVNRFDYDHFVALNPRTSSWASNPDNAAVSGVNEVQRLGSIEQSAGSMRALTPMESLKYSYDKFSDAANRKVMEFPLTRMVVDAAAGAAGMAGNIGSFLGWHGDGPTKQNLLQHIEAHLAPENSGQESNGLDFLAKNVAPMIPAVLATGGASLLAETLGLSSTAAKVLSGLTVGGLFDLDQAGKTYTAVAGSGGSDYAARLAANRVAAINAPANALFGATDVIPLLRDNPLLTSLGLGGATGATGQIGQNVVTGQPWNKDVAGAAVQGAAMQGGMHLGMGVFGGSMADAVDAAEQSELRKRSPEKFAEAMQTIFAGDQSLRVPADQFSAYFKGKGMDPAEVAKGLSSTNYAEATLSGGDVEIPPADFMSKLDPEHQKALLEDIVDPGTGLTARQHQEGLAELEQWATGGGAVKLMADTAAADAETAATPEYQEVKEQLRQRYADAGEMPEVAETLATKDANAFSNLARSAGMKPNELLTLYNPKVVAGEAPGIDMSTHVNTPASEGAPAEATPLHQAGEETPRGWFRVLPDGTYEIGKTKVGDLSTFVHEPAHAYLKILGDLSKREGASDTLKSDYQKVLNFLGAKDGEPLTREQHETWAQANEQYLREGQAPSPGLKGTFQRFGIWLHSIYKKATDLGVELNSDIRGVMDRLYASEQGINKAETEAGPKLFTSPEEAGWTEEQFRKYAEDNNMSAEQAKSEILGKLNEAAVRDRTQAWRDELENVRTAVTAEIDQRPEYTAIRTLRKGALDDGTRLTVSKEDLVKQFGEERVKELQRLHPGLYRSEAGGEDPEIVAEVFGYDSAEEMMKALTAAPRRSAAIETATRDYMTTKHGDIRYDGTLDDQARIALENDTRAEGLHAELKALKQKVAGMSAKASGEKNAMRSIEVAPIASYREAAQQMVESKAVADLQPTRYLDASRKYSREAFDALRAGDPQKAAEAKHKELMNHFLFREATEAKDYIGKFEAYAKRVQKPAAQSKLGLAGGDYRDQFNRLLGRYSLGPEVAPGERTLAEWAASEYDQGKEPAIDPNILNEARIVNYRNAPVAEIRQLHDALINIRKLASLELGMEVNGKRVEFSAAVANMDAQARETLPARPTRVLKGNATLGEKISDLAQRGDALLMRTERLMEWLDGGKTGPWHDNLWNHAADAQGAEYKLQEQVTKQLGDALENIPKEQRARMLDKVAIDGIPETLTRHDLVSMAFNMGNDGNLERLEKTFLAHGWDPAAIEQVKQELTPEEWKFVQDGWNSLKPLGQAQAELEKRLTGLPPVMVKATPLKFQTRLGADVELEGGYYPVVMDSRYSARGAQADAGTSAQNLMEAGYGRAATSRGNMKERTGFGGPLELDFEQVLTQHTAKVIKDITHREFMLAANKLLLDPQIRLAMRETLGDGYEEKMMPWLRTIVNDRNGSSAQGLGDFSRMVRGLRTNLTLATLSYKVSTSLLQWTHAPRMLLSTRPGSYAQAMVDFLAHPSEMTQQIKDLSPNEMAFRGDNLDRDIRETLRSTPGIKRSIAQVGNVSIKYTDHILSFPLWLSVYRDALKEHAGLAEDRAQDLAMYAADSAVRLGLGSGAPKDLPPIMRNNDLAKLFTMFYSFHNGIYGQVRDIGHQFRQAGPSAASVGKLSYGLALSVLAPAVLGGLVSGHGPKDDENKGLWAAKRALLFGADTIPLLRDVASAVDSDGEVKNPLFNMLTKGAKATQEATSESDDKDWKGIGLSYLEVGGDLAGVPGTTQALKPLRYLNQVNKGNVENPNVWDAIAGSAPRSTSGGSR